jgi:hypothetical protein
MKKIGLLLVGLLSLLFLVNTCSAVEFHVMDSLTKYANPGDTVSFNLSVNLTDQDKDPDFYPYTENFSIVNPRLNWVYTFSANNITLDENSTTNTSVLYIQVPAGASGAYDHKIDFKSYNSFFGAETPYLEQNLTIIVNTNVQQVPEFPSIALPVAAVLGLVAIFGRKKEI